MKKLTSIILAASLAMPMAMSSTVPADASWNRFKTFMKKATDKRCYTFKNEDNIWCSDW